MNDKRCPWYFEVLYVDVWFFFPEDKKLRLEKKSSNLTFNLTKFTNFLGK